MTPEAATKTGPRRTASLGVAVFGFAFLLALYPLHCYDVWWHLANGREVASGRGIPRTNLYSFTHPDYEVTPTHWLFGLGAYLVHAAAGVHGLVLLKALLVAAAFTVAYLLARRRGAGGVAAALVVALGVLASRKRFLERPHLFTMLGLAGFAYLIGLVRGGRRPRRRHSGFGASATGSSEGTACPEERGRDRLAWAIPALAALWANLHAGCLFGVGLVGMEAAGEGITWLRSRARRGSDDAATTDARRLMLTFGAVALASAVTVMLSPALWRVYSYNLWHVGLDKVVPLNEFRTATPLGQPLFYAFLILGAAALAAEWRSLRPAEVMAFAVFGALAVYAVRGMPNFALVAAPMIAPRLSRIWQRVWTLQCLAGAKGYLDRIPRAVAGTVVGVALIALPFACHLVSWQYPIGLGVARGFVPEGAARFVEREIESPRVFNDLASGGYLAWRWYPTRRVFIDGRTNAYPPDLLRDLYKGRVSEELVERVLDWYDTNSALLLHYGGGNPFWPAFDLDRWAVVYAEEAALVLVRRTAANRTLIDKCEDRLGARGWEVLSRRLARRGETVRAGAAAHRALSAEAASKRAIFTGREGASLNYKAGLAAYFNSRPQFAVESFGKALAKRPGWVEARVNLGFALFECGKPGPARAEFERALEDRPASPEALLGLARSLRKLGRRAEAAAAYRRFLDTGGGGPQDVEKAKEALESLGP